MTAKKNVSDWMDQILSAARTVADVSSGVSIEKSDVNAEGSTKQLAKALGASMDSSIAKQQSVLDAVKAEKERITSQQESAAKAGDPAGSEKYTAAEKAAADALKKAEAKLNRLKADRALLSKPDTDAKTHNEILARVKAWRSTYEEDKTQIGKWNSSEKSSTATQYDAASKEALTTTDKQEVKLDQNGLTSTQTQETTTTTALGSETSSKTDKTSIGKDGLTTSTVTKISRTDQDGKSDSVEAKSTRKVGLAGASQASSVEAKNADGSASTTEKSSGIERGKGKAGLTSSNKSTTKDAAGNTQTTSSSGKAGIIAGADGLGAYGEAKGSRDIEREGGLKSGIVGGLDGKVVCNVEEIPGKTPKQYKIHLRVELGGSGGINKGKTTKEGGTTQEKGGGIDVSGKTFADRTEVLKEDEAKAYLEKLKSGGRDYAIALVGKAKGGAVAGGMGASLKDGLLDEKSLAAMQEGSSASTGSSGSLGGNLKGSREGLDQALKALDAEDKDAKGVKTTLTGSLKGSHESSTTVTVKDGKYEIDRTEGSGVGSELGGTAGKGTEKGSLSLSGSYKTSTGYKIVLDPGAANFKSLQNALAACKTQTELDQFAIAHPEVIKGQTIKKETSKGGKMDLGGEGGGISLGVGGGLESQASSTFSSEEKDGRMEISVDFDKSDKQSQSGTVGVGVVKGAFKESEGSSAGAGIKVSLDPKDPNFKALRDGLAACQSPEELRAFVKQHQLELRESSERKGDTSASGADVEIAGAKASLAFEAKYNESEKKDKDGKVIEINATGSNKGGVEIGFGSLKVSASTTESAVAKVDAGGKASVDVEQSRSETNMEKWLEQNVPFTGAKTESKGALSALTGAEEKKESTSDTNVQGIKLSNEDLSTLALRASDLGEWMKACPSPRLRDEWKNAAKEIQSKGGSSGATAKALARFVGKEGHGRDDVILMAARKAGDVGAGKRYEFPEGLGALKAEYDRLVCADVVAQVQKAMGSPAGHSNAPDPQALKKAEQAGKEFIAALDKLYVSLGSAASKFQQLAVHGEMLAAISSRKLELQSCLRAMVAGGAENPALNDLLDEYNQHLENCMRFQANEEDLFAGINKKRESQAGGNRHADVIAELIKQIRDLHAVWAKDYDKMAGLAQEHGFGKDRYWKYKPDKKRFNLAVAGEPDEVTAPTPETEDKRPKKKKPLAPPRDYIAESDAELKKVQAKQVSAIEARYRSSRDRAVGAGNRLHAWIQHESKAKAIDCHNKGMEKIRSGNANGAKLPKQPTTEDWSSYGFAAAQDYEEAQKHFNEGLALYPAGKPPKGA